MQHRFRDILIHLVLLTIAAMTLVPFAFVLNNSLRTNNEMNYSFFGLPRSLRLMGAITWHRIMGHDERIMLPAQEGEKSDADATKIAEEPPANQRSLQHLVYREAMSRLWQDATRGYGFAWRQLRPYVLNSLLVCAGTVFGVVVVGSISAYVFSRYRFPGHKAMFLAILSFMMIPGIL